MDEWREWVMRKFGLAPKGIGEHRVIGHTVIPVPKEAMSSSQS